MQHIVKYANRKLYSKNKSGYITLEDVKRMVLNREDFIVTDKKTGEDLTKETLEAVVATLVVEKLNPEFLKIMIISTFKEIDTEQENNYTNDLN